MNLLSPFVSNLLMLGYSKPNYAKWVATLMGLFSLSAGFVLGCTGLYHYLVPQWGKAIALLGIGLVCLAISSVSFAFRFFSIPKPSTWEETTSALEKNLTEPLQQLLNGEEVLKLLRPYISLKSLSVLFVMASAVGFYLNRSKKE